MKEVVGTRRIQTHEGVNLTLWNNFHKFDQAKERSVLCVPPCVGLGHLSAQ